MKKDYKEDLPIEKLKIINEVYKKYDKNCVPYQLCEICIKPINLSICGVCRNYFHSEVEYFFLIIIKLIKCIGLDIIPVSFFCPECEKISKSEEKKIISSFQEINSTSISKNFSENDQVEYESNDLVKRKLTSARRPRRDIVTDLTCSAIHISSVISTQKTKENSNEEESSKKVNYNLP